MLSIQYCKDVWYLEKFWYNVAIVFMPDISVLFIAVDNDNTIEM